MSEKCQKQTCSERAGEPGWPLIPALIDSFRLGQVIGLVLSPLQAKMAKAGYR